VGLVLFVVPACLNVGCSTDEPVVGPLVGTRAPEIVDGVEQWLNGQEVSLADLAGRPVLLYFWHPRDGKSPATLAHVQQLAAAFAERGLATIGLCVCEGPAEVAPLIEQHKLTFPIALDGDADVHVHGYRIDQSGTPYCYLVGRDQLIAWEGPPGKLTARRIRKLLP
jgi:peroxiredoxin